MTEVAEAGSEASWGLLVSVLCIIILGGATLAFFFGIILRPPPPDLSGPGKSLTLTLSERPDPIVEVDEHSKVESPVEAELEDRPPEVMEREETQPEEEVPREEHQLADDIIPAEIESSRAVEFTRTVAEHVDWIGIIPTALPPQPLVIGQVQPGSWGATNSILQGDILMSINGIPSQDMTISDLDDIMRQRPLELHFLRKVSLKQRLSWQSHGVSSKNPPAWSKPLDGQRPEEVGAAPPSMVNV